MSDGCTGNIFPAIPVLALPIMSKPHRPLSHFEARYFDQSYQERVKRKTRARKMRKRLGALAVLALITLWFTPLAQPLRTALFSSNRQPSATASTSAQPIIPPAEEEAHQTSTAQTLAPSSPPTPTQGNPATSPLPTTALAEEVAVASPSPAAATLPPLPPSPTAANTTALPPLPPSPMTQPQSVNTTPASTMAEAYHPLDTADPPPANSGLVRVGIQVGHLNADQHADETKVLRVHTGGFGNGVAEIEVNTQVANIMAQQLTAHGVAVDILPARIPLNYEADAFISLHTDSNNDPLRRGYKSAYFTPSRNTLDPLLKEHIDAAFFDNTGLPDDQVNISSNMTEYYAFNYERFEHSISAKTPGIIVEMGYLSNGQDIIFLTDSKRPATALTQGLLSYLRAQGYLPTPEGTSTHHVAQPSSTHEAGSSITEASAP